ncbi:MAG: hypothetical protein R3F33_14465 [Planctomycetota bacterium]
MAPEKPAAQTPPAPETVEPDMSEPEPEPVVDAYAGWSTFTHPSGGEFRYPQGWAVQAVPNALLLQPPDFDMQSELIIAAASPAGAVSDPMSAEAGASLDGLVAQTMPFLRRKGKPRALKVGDLAGAVYDYRGQAPDGRDVRARSWVLITAGQAVGITMLADKAHLEQRSETVESIFLSMRNKGGKAGGAANAGGNHDARLIGRFRGEAISTGGGIYTNTQLIWAFNADGTVLHGAQTHINASERDHNGDTKWTATGSSDGSVEQGTWSTQGDYLILNWRGGGTATFAYGVEPNGTLAIRDPQTRKLLNFYEPMR